MKISVIIAIYNIELYIDKCISSIVCQNCAEFELLLVNDGSTDSSLQKLHQWKAKDNRIKIINKENGGLSSARNAGLKYATGDYILYVDGDDWLADNAIEIITKYLNAHGEVDMLCFDYYAYYDDDHKKLVSFNAPSEVIDGLSFFKRSSFKMTAWSKVYRKSFLETINLNFLDGRLHEDLSYTIPLCLCAKRVGYINSPLYYYRQNRDGSIMKKISYKNVLDFSHALCFDYQFAKERNLLNNYIKEWIVKNFYKSCFTWDTNYSTLVKAMKVNNVSSICREMGEKYFWEKLFFYHFYMKAKAYLGKVKMVAIKRWNVNNRNT